jgi:hypothetical protein
MEKPVEMAIGRSDTMKSISVLDIVASGLGFARK